LASNVAWQVSPQESDPGELVTVPAPDPVLMTVSLGWLLVKVAVQGMFPVTVTVAVVLLPLHEPLHPANVDPVAAVAVRVTVVLLA
jgi:hypothetical protein